MSAIRQRHLPFYSVLEALSRDVHRHPLFIMIIMFVNPFAPWLTQSNSMRGLRSLKSMVRIGNKRK